MSVNWSWQHKMGELTVKSLKGKNCKVNIYHANCVCAMIYEYKDKETNEDMYQFYGFFSDFNHLKRCIGLAPTKCWDNSTKKNVITYDNIYKNNWVKLKLNIYYRDMLKMAELCAKAGYKVELYYKEPKKKKGGGK